MTTTTAVLSLQLVVLVWP